jgi:hypothetical protein
MEELEVVLVTDELLMRSTNGAALVVRVVTRDANKARDGKAPTPTALRLRHPHSAAIPNR